MLAGQRPLQIFGSGEQTRTLTHVDDIADGIVTAMASAAGENEDFNISASEEHTVAEIAALIWEACGEDPEQLAFEHLPSFEVDVQRRWPSVEKARTLLGWEAAHRPARRARRHGGVAARAGRADGGVVSAIPEEAARGFQRGAADYERGRPGYPEAAIALLARRAGPRPGRVAVDLAAGTGKLTRALLALGADLVAIEPVAGMREQLQRAVPGVTVLDGTAERMPLDDASVNAVFVAQAFHWFDVPAAAAEIHRVLAPGGGLGVVRNEWDESVDWIVEMRALTARVLRPARARPLRRVAGSCSARPGCSPPSTGGGLPEPGARGPGHPARPHRLPELRRAAG